MKIKTAVKIMVVILILSVSGTIALQKKCNKPLQEVAKNDYLLKSDTYHPPIIKLPFTKDKAPVKKKYLPIPKKDVKTTIVVKNPVPGARNITIIVDKKGKVYRSTDTPKDVRIEVTHWKPAFLGFQNKWGVGIIMDIPPDLSFALSWDVIRIWKLHFGTDLGIKFMDQNFADFWIGASVKYRILKKNNLFMLAGYNWTQGVPYVGISMRF